MDSTDEGDSSVIIVNEDDIAQVIEFPEDDSNIEAADDEDDEDDDEGMEISSSAHDGGTELTDNSSLCFKQHSDSVFTSRFNSTGELVVSGGEDDLAYVWSVSDGSIILKCVGHKDSVTCVGFNYDNSYVATSDMSGLVQVWQINTKSVVWSFEVSDIEWMMWHPMSNVLLVGTVEGDFWMWKIPSGDCKTFPSYGSKSTCAKITPDGFKMCVGYEDGSMRVWELKHQTVVHTFSDHSGHTDGVTCLDTQEEGSLVGTGSVNGRVNLSSHVTGKLLATLTVDNNPQQQQQEQEQGEGDKSVESLSFSKNAPLLAFGSLNSNLYIYDISSQTLRHTCRHDDGPVRLSWLPDSSYLYTACLDGCVKMWDARNGQCVTTRSGHTDMILDMDMSRDGKLIVTSSVDNTARIFNITTSAITALPTIQPIQTDS